LFYGRTFGQNGYGLSYTTFGYENSKISANKFSKKLKATVDIINTGQVGGKEVVQAYLSTPLVNLDKPSQELRSCLLSGCSKRPGFGFIAAINFELFEAAVSYATCETASLVY
jgi:hypothetical protein